MKAVSLLLTAILIACCCLSCKKTTKPEELITLTISPESGGYSPQQTIVISCNYSDADICYTTDGSEPTQNSSRYVQPLSLESVINTQSNFAMLKVKAFKDGYQYSETICLEYHIDFGCKISTPVISPDDGAYDSGSLITISCNQPEAKIRYTINGTEPNPYSALYLQPITLTHSGKQDIKARAFLQNWNPSSCNSASYHINHPLQDMILVEGGSFDNGTSNVTLSSFHMDKTEVLQGEYYDVMAANVSVDLISKGSYPVYYVSWFDAIEYCNKRSMLDNLAPCYRYIEYCNKPSMLDNLAPCYTYKDLGVNPANWTEGWNALGADPNAIICNWEASGYRLPTEMEWMFAAKGGNLSLGYQYSGADSIYTVGWFSGNSGYTVHQVAGRVPNELGIFDLSGNLWEWCWDNYGAYPSANQNNPHGASNGSNKVLRGGCWSSSAASCQISERYQSAPSQSQAAGFGFRCVKRAP